MGYIDYEIKDILYEIGNVGLGMASITVGKIMGVRMHIGVPSIVPVNDELTLQLQENDKKITILMDFQKTLRGSMLFILETGFVNEVINKMGGQEAMAFDENERISVIQEFANMLCAAYLKAVGQYTGIRLYVKPAGIKIKETDGIIKQTIDKLTSDCKKAICVDTGFSIVYENGEVIDDVGHVVMLPDEESVEKLIEPLCE